jgi:type II secretory ATPase GspE/PulE/Tfp pilus assembly ATPase PilB-like protein
MGIAPYSLNSSITAIIAQRLVRRLCITCRKERPPTDVEYEGLGLSKGKVPVQVFDADGCSECGGTGFKGRLALFEILEVTEPIRALVSAGASPDAIYAEAREQGMRTLFESGIEAVMKGVTPPNEVLRVVLDDRR